MIEIRALGSKQVMQDSAETSAVHTGSAPHDVQTKQDEAKKADSFKTADMNNDDTSKWLQRVDEDEIREHQENGMEKARKHV